MRLSAAPLKSLLVAVGVVSLAATGIGFAAPAQAQGAPSGPGVTIEGQARADSHGNFAAVATVWKNGKPHFVRVAGSTKAKAQASALKIQDASAVNWDAPVDSQVVTYNDPQRAFQWDLDTLNIESTALPSQSALNAVTVAVVDTGVDSTHPDLAGVVNCTAGEDLATDASTADPAGKGCVDPNGHGTHVSGTIAAISNNAIGVASIASGVKILPIRVLDSSGSGYSSSISQGIIDATDKGASVINLSLGGPGQTTDEVTAVSYALSHNVVVVAAAGNYGTQGNPVIYPGAISGVVAVSATDNTNTAAPWSESGPQVAIAAPGASIVSTTPGSNYAYMSGTSMASPHVAATAALIKAKYPSATQAQIVAQLENTATDLGATGRDDLYGHGLVSPFNAMATALGGTPANTVPGTPAFGTVVTSQQNGAQFNWVAPYDGGTAITNYRLTATPSSGTVVTATPSASVSQPYSLPGLVAGTAYSVTIAAENTVGWSAESAPVSVTVPVTIPPVTIPPVTAPPVTPPVTLPPASSLPAAIGYRILSGNGHVYAYGASSWYGDATGKISGNAVTIAATPDNGGYWVATDKGEVITFGDAPFYGSMAGRALNQPVINMAVTPTGHGYWLLAKDGGVFSFGDASFHGSTGNLKLNKPAVGMTPTADGGGYWFVASDGGIFAFGDASFYGSMGSATLNKPVVGMTVSASGHGYRMVASDGGIFSFGDAAFFGSLGSAPPGSPVQAMLPTPSSAGYFMVSQDGSLYSFGDAQFYGHPSGAMVAISD